MLPLSQINEQIGNGSTVVDLGCGAGVIAKYLAQNRNRKVIGIDLNKKRLPKSSQKNLTFEAKDIIHYKPKNADVVILSDVLHHINFNDQEKVLKNIAFYLKKGGVLIIKEIDTQEFLRSTLSRFWDFVFYPTEKVYFSDAKKLKKKLRTLGFSIEIKRPIRFFPGSTTLFICTK